MSQDVIDAHFNASEHCMDEGESERAPQPACTTHTVLSSPVAYSYLLHHKHHFYPIGAYTSPRGKEYIKGINQPGLSLTHTHTHDTQTARTPAAAACAPLHSERRVRAWHRQPGHTKPHPHALREPECSAAASARRAGRWDRHTIQR